MSISPLQKVFTDQTVTIKGAIKRLSGVKKVYVGESSIDKKDLTVVNPTGSIRVVVMVSYCEKEVLKDIRTYSSASDTNQTSLEITLIRLKMVPAQLESVTHSKKLLQKQPWQNSAKLISS